MRGLQEQEIDQSLHNPSTNFKINSEKFQITFMGIDNLGKNVSYIII